jgi:hypothetical protein
MYERVPACHCSRVTKLRVLVALMAVLLGSSACSSGQTGSPRCGPPSTCACLSLERRDVFRGHIVAFEGAMIEVELEEIYSEATSPVLVPGARGTFRYSVGPDACSDYERIPELRIEDTVLVALDLRAGEMWLVPWTDPLNLVDRQVPVDTLVERADSSLCDADLEPEPCGDTPGGFLCATSRATGDSRGSWVVALLIGVASLRVLRSRAKKRLNPRPGAR